MFGLGSKTINRYLGNRPLGPGGNVVSPPQWRDAKFPLTGQRLDSSSGRIDYNYVDGTVDYQDNARYPEELVIFTDQRNHDWAQGTYIRPHIHWDQNQAGTPNILMEYIMYDNLSQIPTTWTKIVIDQHEGTWTSGKMGQLSYSDLIDASSLANVSAITKWKLYRDTNNTSGLFAGADTYTGNWQVTEFDIHEQVDGSGSTTEFSK